jgi:aspartate racemase
MGRRLPAHLVPAAAFGLDEVPRTANGKLDHAALAVPAAAAARHRPPATPTEAEVVGIYAELLGRAEVGADDDFFALGGQSLVAVRAVVRIRQRFGIDLPVRALFAAPTAAGLARTVDDALLATADPQTLAALLDHVEAQ